MFNLKVVGKLQVMENIMIGIANRIMSDIKWKKGNTHKEKEKQDGNNSLGEMLHSKMQEVHGKKLWMGSFGKTQTGGGYSIWSNKLHNQ
jgi:hypothetical protein